jgi:SPP1 family predicted phage head-tail adaptor
MPAAGDLSWRVQFRRATRMHDGISTTETFVDIGGAVWASKRDVTDIERWRAAEVQATITTRFIVRWSHFTACITPKDRLVCDGREYEITGIRETVRREELEITAAARSDR